MVGTVLGVPLYAQVYPMRDLRRLRPSRADDGIHVVNWDVVRIGKRRGRLFSEDVCFVGRHDMPYLPG